MESDYRVDEASRTSKMKLKAPCVFTIWDDRKNMDVETYPAVHCNHECDRCGWNPAVGKKRIQALLERLAKEGRKL